LIDVEGEPPVAAYRNTPCPGSVAFKLMNSPAGWADNPVNVGGGNQHRENVAQPSYEVAAKFPAVVVLDEAQKPSMLNTSNNHAINVRFDRTLVKQLAALYLK
jgi:hypothetical protein